MKPSFDELWDGDQSIQKDEDWDRLDARAKKEIVQIAADYAYSLVSLMDHCESPIEQLLGIWIQHLADILQFGDDGCFVVNPQYEVQTSIGLFRVDFMVATKIKGKYVSVAVECDGHNFHEKTKAQAARDKKRDRALKLAGEDIIRFAGSEIWANPEGCAREVLRQLQTMVNC